MGDPIPNAEVTESTRQRLAEMREAGIKTVEVIGCNYSQDECDAFRAIKGKRIPIQDAPLLPLPGCDKQHCKCLIIAKEA